MSNSPGEPEQSIGPLQETCDEPRPKEPPLRAFVFLAHGFGARDWTLRWAKGNIPGLNERLPYGYYRAANANCIVKYSEDADEGRLTALLRRMLRKILGCDLIHAWRNRKALLRADVVWAHTELEYLAVLAFWQWRKRAARPKLIAHSVWIFDRWKGFSATKRWLYRRLMNEADILTVLSPDSYKVATALFPQVRTELIPFGSNLDLMIPPSCRAAHSPVHIVALGNDMHRDWATLLSASRQCPDCIINIVSQKIDWRMVGHARNIRVTVATSLAEVVELYSWADIAVVPLKHNLHVSGITVICEAVLRGVPVVCTDTGGLRAYFAEGEVRYVPLHDPPALCRALRELAKNDRERFAMAERAQARMRSADLSSRAFATRHYEISRELLRQPANSKPEQVYDATSSGHWQR
jgi:glycosyltransferase involved in cell wall biosynthesis